MAYYINLEKLNKKNDLDIPHIEVPDYLNRINEFGIMNTQTSSVAGILPSGYISVINQVDKLFEEFKSKNKWGWYKLDV